MSYVPALSVTHSTATVAVCGSWRYIDEYIHCLLRRQPFALYMRSVPAMGCASYKATNKNEDHFSPEKKF